MRHQFKPNTLRPLIYRLRHLGFSKECDSRSDGGGVVQFHKAIDDRRTVDVQLWSDRQHRVSHSFRGCSDTEPTAFTDAMSMLAAIEHESTRTDSKYAKPDTLATEKAAKRA